MSCDQCAELGFKRCPGEPYDDRAWRERFLTKERPRFADDRLTLALDTEIRQIEADE